MQFFVLLFLMILSSSVFANSVWPKANEYSNLRVYDKSDIQGLGTELEKAYPYDIASLVPDRFSVIQKQKTQPLIDLLVEKVFQAKSVQKSLCFLTKGSTENLQVYLGITKKSAARVQKSCAAETLSDRQRWFLNRMEFYHGLGDQGKEWTETLALRPWERGKIYAFILAKEGTATVSGFTTRENLTLFFVPKEGIEETNLVRLMAHELAITFDQLNSIAPTMSILDEWEGRMFSELYGGSISRPAFKPVESAVALRCALRDPALRYALIIERASRFEDRVLQDLGVSKSDSPSQAAGKDCRGSLVHWASLQASLAEMTTFEQVEMISDCGNPGKDPQRAQTVADRINLLDSTNIQQITTGKIFNLCELLLEPQVGFRRPDFYRSGPRPRIGGWGNLTVNLSDGTTTNPATIDANLNRLVQIKKIQPQKLRLLNDSLKTIDPMGGAPTFDEIILQVKSGKATSYKEAVDQLTIPSGQ